MRLQVKIGLLAFILAASLWQAFPMAGVAGAAEVTILEPTLPEYSGIPIALQKENLITRELGGRALNLDVFAGLYGSYESNIYQTANNEISDYIITPMAGFIGKYTQKDVWNINFDGMLAYHFYTDHSDLNDFIANAHIDGDAKFNDTLAANLGVGYRRNYATEGPVVEGIEPVNHYMANGGITISPSELMDVQLGGTFYRKAYESTYREAVNYDEATGFVRPEYQLTPNSTISLKGTYGNIWHDEDIQNNADYVEGVVGYEWAYMDTMRFSIEAGWQWRDYDNSGTVPDTSDYSDPVVRVSVDYAFAMAWTGTLAYSHVPREGEDPGYNYDTVDALSLGIVYSPRERFSASLRPYVNYVDPSYDTYQYYWEYGGTLGFRYSFTELFSVGASYKLQNRSYENSQNDWIDQIVTLGVNLTL